jgi:DNA polymerase-3 subunit delta
MEIRTFNEFKKLIDSNKLKSPILIYGEEKYLIKECVREVMNKIVSFPELNIVTLENENISMDNIINACETIPFISQHKIVHIKNPEFIKKSTKNTSIENQTIEKSSFTGISDQIVNYIKDVSEDLIVLITFNGEIEVKNKLPILIKNIGTLIQLNELKGAELQKYVTDIFQNHGRNINKSELIYFISEVGTSLSLIEKEVEKLCLFNIGEDSITKSDIDAIVSKTAESNIFKMVDNISKKDAAKAILILNTLLFQKEDHLKILGMIIRQYRILLTIKLNLINKTPLEEVRSVLKLNEYVFQNMIKQCGLYSESSLKKALSCLLRTDSEIKISKLNPDLALEMLLVELCK